MIDIKIKKRIEWFSNNQINDFAPTISPASKYMESNEIESIRQAVKYFLRKNQTEIVVQKKYMGSYCSIYLKRNLADTYFISRNGHKIEHTDLEIAKNSLKELHQKMLMQYPDFDTLIIASELLPWSILGGGLIEREYNAYHDALETHTNYLENSNLYNKMETVKASESYVKYFEDKKALTNKEFKVKYPNHVIRQYEAIANFKVLDIPKQKESLAIFKTQIDTFGKEGALHFKPFNVLKIVYQDGKETIPNSNLTYALVNDDVFLHLNFTPENEAENLAKIDTFFDTLTTENEEGIMIKPAKSYVKGLPPCFKVRNNNYLTMIYGINFNANFEYYLERRNIKRKLEQSINGWEINQQMLEIPYKALNAENYLMKLLLLKRINNEEIEKTLDPRL
ncbi:hypothetical protein FIA58_002505 [Flavobacterium jejuense]|uniref:Polynucleotide kinase-phosphatase ligase domain-containing protein n=1 Tax=Flavobacterium jejuense TaxID=1544455 RepID=A0ABX0IQY4_9FLAO|nr:hypothetical protein [Flavobacterium jejuense]NHN24536.1 hypothetical protein [Flavobacterium jejuense]